jgi:hypothetical protein
MCVCLLTSVKRSESENESKRGKGKRAGGDNDDDRPYALPSSSSLVILCNNHLSSRFHSIFASILRKKNSFSTSFSFSHRKRFLHDTFLFFSTIPFRLVHINKQETTNSTTRITTILSNRYSIAIYSNYLSYICETRTHA